MQSKVGYWNYHGITFNTSIFLSKCISLVKYTQILLLKFLYQFGFKNPIFIKMGSTNCLKWVCLTLKIEDLLITKRGVELDAISTKIRFFSFLPIFAVWFCVQLIISYHLCGAFFLTFIVFWNQLDLTTRKHWVECKPPAWRAYRLHKIWRDVNILLWPWCDLHLDVWTWPY